ncbi:MAG: anti-sigma factor family protein [Phycisphaerae bacterium]
MRCENVQEQLNRFAAGNLPVTDRRNVQAHLVECAACRAKLAELDALAGVVAGTPTPPLPSGFASRVMAVARKRQETQPVAVWNLLRWWRLASGPMHVAAAAVLIVGLSVGVLLGWTSSPQTAPTETATQTDPVDAYQIDYLGEAPSGSLANSYLTLVSTSDEEGR